HALHRENPAFRFDPEPSGRANAETAGRLLRWQPYEGVPGLLLLANGEYRHAPEWYRSFLYDEERRRGLEHVEDLASPGTLRFDLTRGEAVCAFAMDTPATRELLDGAQSSGLVARLRVAERRRRRFGSA